jgi:hypothetical protein
MDEMAEPRGLRGYLAGENDGPGGEAMPEPCLCCGEPTAVVGPLPPFSAALCKSCAGEVRA